MAFRVELALTPEEQERGLMFREHLDADAGMLFVFEAPSAHVFWMKNTLIPLDMIFIGADWRIAGIVENAEPQTLTDARGRRRLAVRAGDWRRSVGALRHPRRAAGRFPGGRHRL